MDDLAFEGVRFGVVNISVQATVLTQDSGAIFELNSNTDMLTQITVAKNMNFTDAAPDGTSVVGRCSWEHASDFASVTGTCEQFTGGAWWTYRKVSSAKVK